VGADVTGAAGDQDFAKTHDSATAKGDGG
jgi:hypothetical protein